MISGVYFIECLDNSKFYIGSSYNIKRRWQEHGVLLRKNKSRNKYLQNAWNKHGEHSFRFVIVQYVPNVLDAIEATEQAFLDFYFPTRRLYNLSAASKGSRGYKHTEETKRRLSEASRNCRPEIRATARVQMKRLWSNPMLREERIEAMKRAQNRSEEKTRKSKAAKIANNIPGARAMRSVQAKRLWQDPNYRSIYCKLTTTDVRVIRMRLDWGDNQPNIAADYLVGRAMIGAIKRGERWNWLDAKENRNGSIRSKDHRAY